MPQITHWKRAIIHALILGLFLPFISLWPAQTAQAVDTTCSIDGVPKARFSSEQIMQIVGQECMHVTPDSLRQKIKRKHPSSETRDVVAVTGAFEKKLTADDFGSWSATVGFIPYAAGDFSRKSHVYAVYKIDNTEDLEPFPDHRNLWSIIDWTPQPGLEGTGKSVGIYYRPQAAEDQSKYYLAKTINDSNNTVHPEIFFIKYINYMNARGFDGPYVKLEGDIGGGEGLSIEEYMEWFRGKNLTLKIEGADTKPVINIKKSELTNFAPSDLRFSLKYAVTAGTGGRDWFLFREASYGNLYVGVRDNLNLEGPEVYIGVAHGIGDACFNPEDDALLTRITSTPGAHGRLTDNGEGSVRIEIQNYLDQIINRAYDSRTNVKTEYPNKTQPPYAPGDDDLQSSSHLNKTEKGWLEHWGTEWCSKTVQDADKNECGLKVGWGIGGILCSIAELIVDTAASLAKVTLDWMLQAIGIS